MEGRRGIKVAVLMALLGVVLALVSACGGGVSQQDYDAVKQQLAAKEQELAARGTGGGAGPAAEALRQQVASLQQQLQ
ncbi:MAG: hypothetical protein HY532_07220, partial [Chloroflexi bacterium]|nr:hypothetical protein [Chloroflexota bacterium]